MSTDTAHIPRKRVGGKAIFAEATEDEISLRYYDGGDSSATLAKLYAAKSRTGKCSASAIRQIAERSYRRAKESQLNTGQGGI